MLTPDMLAAETITPPLSEIQKRNLLVLCKGAFPAYVSVFSAALVTGIIEEMGNPTEVTQVLKAVLTQLNNLPAEVVESQGNVEDPAFFTTPQNWMSLAIDVLNAFDITVPVGASAQQTVAIVQRTVDGGLLLDDNIYQALNPQKTGRRL